MLFREEADVGVENEIIRKKRVNMQGGFAIGDVGFLGEKSTTFLIAAFEGDLFHF